MCTVVILRRPGHDWPLILAANRDEMTDRPWRPPGRYWSERAEVTAGQDEFAGGTWLGLNDWGVIAGVLNRPGSLGPDPGLRSRGELPLEALDHLSYGRMVLLETMRLYPPAWAIFRVSTAPDVIGGYPIPAQSYLMISPYLMHRHPDFWEHEHAFIPERFERGEVSDARAFHYLPFGHGPHTCVGKRMALVESQTILALIARSFRLTRTTTEPVNVVPGIIIRAKETIWMTPERRQVPVVLSSELKK